MVKLYWVGLDGKIYTKYFTDIETAVAQQEKLKVKGFEAWLFEKSETGKNPLRKRG